MRDVNFKFLLASLIILVLTIPLLQEYTPLVRPELLEVVFGVSLIPGVLSLAGHMKEFLVALAVGLFALLCAVIAVLSDNELFRHLMMGAVLVFFSFAIFYSSRQVFLEGEVDFNKIIGAVCIFFMLAVLWAILYQFVEVLTPGSFTHVSLGPEYAEFQRLVYFSLVTLTTLGYGDTTPATPLAGVLAALEAVVGVFYIAILVAALVADFMATRNADRNPAPGSDHGREKSG